MKKIYFLLFFLVFSKVYANDGVYFIDTDYLLKNSIIGKSLINKLENINKKNISEIDKNQQELNDLENEISKQKNIISKDELNKKIENLKQKIKIYNKEKNKKITEFNNLKNKELSLFFKQIAPLIEDFMKQNSIKIVLDRKNIFIADSNYDITNSVLEVINIKLK